MSEYQHYEFHAIDKPLSEGERASISEMSSRVRLSPRKAVFTYSYSDFRYNEEEVLIEYFDFMLYLTGWGTKRIMMKFPIGLVDFDVLKKYRISILSDYEQEIRVFKRDAYAVIDVMYHEEDGIGWIDEGNRKSYVEAVSRIIEIKMMNDYFETGRDFEELLYQIRSDYSRKSSFMKILKHEKLIE